MANSFGVSVDFLDADRSYSMQQPLSLMKAEAWKPAVFGRNTSEADTRC